MNRARLRIGSLLSSAVFTRAETTSLCVILEDEEMADCAEQIMNEKFEDIKIISKPDPLKVKAGSKPYTRIFAFPISAVPPRRWNELLIQEWTCRIMQSPRQIWVKSKELIIDCHSEELALIIEYLGVDIHIVNRKYRKEIENELARSCQENAQAVEDKRIDAAMIKKILDEIVLPNE
jgi:hypothetical protein